MKNLLLKSIGAIFAGFITVVILSTVTDLILETLNAFPKGGLLVTWMLVLALAYRCLYTILGGFVTAKLAPNLPMKHVKILGILGTIAGTLGIIIGWNLSAHWYPIMIAVTAFPCTWLGGQIATKK